MNTKKVYTTRHHPLLKRLWKPLENGLRAMTMSSRDHVHNLRHVNSDQKIAVVRHRHGLPSYYKRFLNWTSRNLPEVHSRMELRILSSDFRDWSKYALVVPWIPDTLLYRSVQVRKQALELTASADSHGVPVINRPEYLLKTSKHDCAHRIANLGVRAPWVRHIEDVKGFKRDLNGLKPPMLVREDLAHGGWSPIFLVREPGDARDIPLEEFAHPIAAEFIDVRDPRDGLVRKYRYMAMGDTGIAHTLQISQEWEVRSGSRLLNDQTKREEIAYSDAPDPYHDILQRVRRELGLDFLAFDYSLDQNGQLVVWEINVLPGLVIPAMPGREHLTPPIERAMAATLKLYLERAGLNVPDRLEGFLTVKPRGDQVALTARVNRPTDMPNTDAAIREVA